MKFLINQLEHFNILMLAVIFTFQVLMAKSNTQKMLKEQSQELYNELEEIKDEIRGNARKRE
jgi:energy-converting hydrogenase Eha subunit H